MLHDLKLPLIVGGLTVAMLGFVQKNQDPSSWKLADAFSFLRSNISLLFLLLGVIDEQLTSQNDIPAIPSQPESNIWSALSAPWIALSLVAVLLCI